MFYCKKIILLLFLFFFWSNGAVTNENFVNLLKDEKKIIFIRHALAPGSGDPTNFTLNDCKTQRNLSKDGINQSRNIGKFFFNNEIKIGKVFSSQWCRCKDTAKIAFGEYEVFNVLNSFYDKKYSTNEDRQIKELKKFIKNWDEKDNLIFVTHFVVISSLLNTSVSSGEIIITDKKLKILARKEVI